MSFELDRRLTMPNDKMVRGTNFTCFYAGPMEGWAQFRLEPPAVPLPTEGRGQTRLADLTTATS
jgi:hypothetical protein